MKIPAQYLPIMPYLILPDAENFVVFAKQVFGATEQLIVPSKNNKIMHGELKIGPAVVMLSNGNGEGQKKTASMFLYVEDVNKVYTAAISHSAKSLQVPQKLDYGFSAGFEDPFGNQWWITEPEK